MDNKYSTSIMNTVYFCSWNRTDFKIGTSKLEKMSIIGIKHWYENYEVLFLALLVKLECNKMTVTLTFSKNLLILL